MSADKKSNQSQIAQATLDEINQSVKVTVVANDAASIAADMNLESIDGNPVAVGAGNVTTGTQRVVLASNQPTIPVDIQDTTLAVSLDYTEDSITIYAPNSNTTPIPVSGSVNVSQLGGNSVATGAGATTSGTQRVVLANDQLPLPVTGSFSATVTSAAALDVLGTTITGGRNNQVEISFDTAPGVGLITNTTSGGGSVTHSNGHALYSTGTGLTAVAKGVSVQKTEYRPAHEIYAFFTAAFTTPTSAASYQRIGLYDAANGFFIGYQGLTFGVTKRTNSIDTFIPASSFNSDLLSGLPTSTFTRNGIAEAINYGFSNLFRIRFAWLGSANILFEVFSPDGKWVTFHNIRQPNTSLNPSIVSPNLPMTIDVSKTLSDTTNLTVYSACWAAGTTSELDNLTATLTDNSLASLNRSVITGQTSAGGGGYVNVKVTPSGSLTTAIGDITGIVGQQTMANSVPVVIASNQTAVPVSQSGTWNIGSVTTLPSIPAGNNNIGDVDVVSVPAPLNVIGAGAAASALRVQLADESLTALENITVTVSNEVEVKNDAGNPVPVSGTVAATQSGTWNINNISGIVSLPTGAATAAKQDLLLAELELKANLNETQPVEVQDTRYASYTASVRGVTTATTATDIFTITGSATKLIKIVRIYVAANATASSYQSIELIKRSTVNTGGTSTTLSNINYDSTDIAGTAVVRSYTANPTLGTTVGRIGLKRLYISALTNANNGQYGGNNSIEFSYDGMSAKHIALRSDSEVLAINLNGTTIAGSSFDIFIEWTEE